MFSSNSDDENSDDEWFFNSFTRYDDLLMFDVHGSITSAALLNDSRLLLATSGSRHEILELSIPKKLTAGKNAGLTKDRDFKVITAGYTTDLIKRMIPIHSGIVTSGFNGVNYYSIPDPSDGTDVIALRHPVRTDVTDAAIAVHDDCVFHGSELSGITSFNLMSRETQGILTDSESDVKEESSRLVSELDCKCNQLFICLKNRECVFSCDIRQSLMPHKIAGSESTDRMWTMSVSDTANHFATFSSSGTLNMHDSRKLTEPVFTSTVKTGKQDDNILDKDICVQICPYESLVSTSGLTTNVHVFDFQGSGGESNFCHDGHRGENIESVVTHLWHPSQERLIFSAGNTGELQAWRYRLS